MVTVFIRRKITPFGLSRKGRATLQILYHMFYHRCHKKNNPSGASVLGSAWDRVECSCGVTGQSGFVAATPI